MKKLITVTVSYPVTFQIEVDSQEEFSVISEKILAKADYYLESSSVKPIITAISVDGLVN
jgi:hypothetical protein